MQVNQSPRRSTSVAWCVCLDLPSSCGYHQADRVCRPDQPNTQHHLAEDCQIRLFFTHWPCSCWVDAQPPQLTPRPMSQEPKPCVPATARHGVDSHHARQLIRTISLWVRFFTFLDHVLSVKPVTRSMTEHGIRCVVLSFQRAGGGGGGGGLEWFLPCLAFGWRRKQW